MGAPERNEDLGLFPHLRISLVPGRTFSKEVKISRVVRRPMGQHGESFSQTSHPAAVGAKCVGEQETSRQYGAES